MCIAPTSVSISQVYSSLTVCINKCRALVVKGLITPKVLDHASVTLFTLAGSREEGADTS